MAATIGAYINKQGKSFPTIKITGNGPKADKFPLTMGLSKCKLVLAHLEEIRAFVESDPEPTQGVASSDEVIVE